MEQALCFRYRRKVAKDNTVKYRWRTLQQLPDQDRPSYAGVRVEVLERPDGRLLVEYKGRLIPTQEAPPRPSLMRVLSQTPSLNGSANGSGYHHHPLAALESRGINDAKSNRPKSRMGPDLRRKRRTTRTGDRIMFGNGSAVDMAARVGSRRVR